MTMENISGEIAELADKFQEAAGHMFLGDKRFTSINAWDDGDYHVYVQHTFTIPNAKLGERHREVISYKKSKHDKPMYRILYEYDTQVDDHVVERNTRTLVEKEIE